MCSMSTTLAIHCRTRGHRSCLDAALKCTNALWTVSRCFASCQCLPQSEESALRQARAAASLPFTLILMACSKIYLAPNDMCVVRSAGYDAVRTGRGHTSACGEGCHLQRRAKKQPSAVGHDHETSQGIGRYQCI